MRDNFSDITSRAIQSLLVSKGQAWDDEGGQGPGLLKTFEALEAILIPLNQMQQDYNGRGDLNGEVLRTLKTLREELKTKLWTPEPYLTEVFKEHVRTRLQPKDMACVDVASFALSTFVDGAEYLARRGQEKHADVAPAELKQWLETAALWLLENAHSEEINGRETNAWGWGQLNASVPSVYFTYTAAVGIAAYLNPDMKEARRVLGDPPKELEASLQRVLDGAGRWAEDILATWRDGRLALPDEVRKTSEVSRDEVYLPHLLLTIEAARTGADYQPRHETISTVLSALVELVEKKQHFVFRDPARYIIPIRGKGVPYEDRTLTYLATAALSWGSSQLKPDDPLSPQVREAVAVLVKEILADRGADAPVWSREGFEIYRTQRALEALTYVALYLGPEVVEAGLESQVTIYEAVRASLSDEEVIQKISELIGKHLDAHRPDLIESGEAHSSRSKVKK